MRGFPSRSMNASGHRPHAFSHGSRPGRRPRLPSQFPQSNLLPHCGTALPLYLLLSRSSVQASMDPPPAKAEAAAARSTLLDVQEVEWITRELERLLAKEQSGDGVGDAGAAGRHRRKRARLSPAPAAHKGGFLADLLGRHAVSICSGDTVDHSTAAAADRGRRRGGRGGFREVEKV